MPEPKFIDIDKLCQRYDFRKWTVRTWCSQNRIPYVKAGGRKVLFDIEEIERWLKQQEVKPASISQVVGV